MGHRIPGEPVRPKEVMMWGSLLLPSRRLPFTIGNSITNYPSQVIISGDRQNPIR